MGFNNKPKTIKVSKEVREEARWIIKRFDHYAKEFTGIDHNTRVAPELVSDTKPIIKNSLAGAICTWVMENPETWLADWYRLEDKYVEQDSLVKNKTGSFEREGTYCSNYKHRSFLRNGYKNLKAPNLAWMFSSTGSREMGLVRVISGDFDNWKQEHYSDGDMV